MREAMGGTVLFQLMAAFVVIYIGVMAVGINYATTLRVKNQIINILENNDNYEEAASIIETYLTSVNYYGGASKIEFNQNFGGVKCLNNTSNYCIEKITLTSGGYYYVVTTYITLNFPLVGELKNLPVKGETSIMGRLENI